MLDLWARAAEAGYLAPASFGQERLYAMEQLRPGLSSYAMSHALLLDGALDVGLVRAAIAAVLARHDGLRATFRVEGDSLSAFVRDTLAVEIPLLTDAALDQAAQRGAVDAALRVLAGAPFDLALGPLLRFRLIRLSARRHVLAMAVHHAVADGQSLALFQQDFATAYGALARGAAPFAAELAVQFADFAAWERAQAAAHGTEHAAYWRAHLAGAPPVLDLPLDFPRGGGASGPSGATVARALPGPAVDALIAIARTRGATPAMALLSVLGVLLARWTGAADIVAAMPVSRRSRAELADVIGLLVDLLPLRLAVPEAASFAALVDGARTALAGALSHNAVPFERIVDLAGVARRADAQPFQQVLFGFEAEDDPGPVAAGQLTVAAWPSDAEQDAKAELSFLVERRGGAWRIALRYDCTLFAAATAARLLDWFAALCTEAAARPDAPVRDLALEPPAVTTARLHALNATARALPAPATLAALFEAQAAAAPGAPALTADPGRTLDYATLNRRANRLAHYLARRGIGRGHRVALATPAGVELIVAMLAVIKRGAAYVPLDPALPAARQLAMLESAAVGTILTAGETPPGDGRAVIDVRRAGAAIARERAANPPPAAGPDDLAYIMFTSGSTGAPKGVAVPQRGVVRLVRNSDFLAIGPADRVGMAAPVSFDASTLEIWGALLNGALLVQVPRETLFSAAGLSAFIARTGLSVLWLTKGLFDQLAASYPATFNGLRVLLTGGDAANGERFARVLAASAGSGLTLLNGYGPTENTTLSAVWRAALPLPAAIPIGRAIANSRAYVLDAALRPLPPGIAGELYVAGDGLAQGYCGRADLTAERFLPDPFALAPGARMYRTGDLARLRDDGAIAFLGRADDQVKIRGFRIEPGEIEAALARHPAVAASHVGVRDDGAAGKRLVAYVVVRAGMAPAAGDIRAHLAGLLPDYMLPAAIVMVPELALTANGKVDRARLPEPGGDAAPAAFAPPRGATEAALAAIWAQVLKREAVGRDDNFFDLGGDSILTIRIAARAAERGLAVTPKQIFAHQTLAALAAAVDAAPRAARGRQARRAPADEAPIPPGTGWVAASADLSPGIDAVTFGLALGDLRRRHAALRLHLAGDAGAPVLAPMDAPPPVPVSLHRLDAAAPETAFAAVADTLASGLDPADGRVLRGALFDRGQGPQRVMLLMHRLVADEALAGLLLDDLAHELAETGAARRGVTDCFGNILTPPDFPLAGLDKTGLEALLRGRADVADIYPLSPMQEGMLVHALAAPSSAVGFEQACVLVEGALDVAALRAAWQGAVDRHAILRTSFAWDGLARPLQIVHRRLPLDMRVHDWSDLAPAEQERRLGELLAQDRREGFRLDQAPLLRHTLVRTGAARFVLVSSYHHILLDGWCLPLLEREVREAYEAAVAGRSAAPPPSRPYRDYIAWLQRQDRSASRRHFEALLAGWVGTAPRTAPAGPTRIARAPLALTADETQAVAQFARTARLTIGVLVHAAWGLALMQRGGTRDVVFATTVSGRPPELPGVEAMLGLFINNLPVRLAANGEVTVAAALAGLQAQLLELRQHEAASPLDIEACAPARAGALCDSLVVVENVPSALREWDGAAGLRFTLQGSDLKTAYALTLVAVPGEALQFSLVFDAARIAPDAAEALLAQTRRLLAAVAAEPEAPLESLLHDSAAEPAAAMIPRAQEDYVAPRSTTEVQIAQIAEELLGIAPIGVTEDLLTCGMTSLTVARLARRLGETFGRDIPLARIIAEATIARLAAALSEAHGSPPAWQGLVPIGQGRAARSFYCVHPIAGDVTVFLDLARAMTPARRFVALQAPGLGAGDPEPDSVEALAELYLDALEQDCPGPITIGGYSFGGVVAFEIARQLRARGREVQTVGIIDTPAPAGAPAEMHSDAQWLWRMLRVRERFHGVDLGLTLADLEQAPDAHALAAARLRTAGLLAEGSDAALLRRMAALGQRHYEFYRKYKPTKIDAPLAVIRAAELDPEEAATEAAARFALDDLGWSALTSTPVRTAVTPGNHVTMMRPPFVNALATALERLT